MTAAAPKQSSTVFLSVVAPCHNEEAGLSELNQRISAVCKDVVGDDFELVLINDGSDDNTWQEILKLAQQYPHIKGINLSRNFGHQLALSAGLQNCKGDRILVIDADLQDPPELLAEMMALMDDGADVVYGKRTVRHGDRAWRKLASAVFYRLLNKLSNVNIPADTGDFRLMSRRVLDVLLSMPEHHRYIRGLISWIGFKQVPCLYERDPRVSGATSYDMKRLISFSIDAITGFSIKPLRLVNILGLVFIGISILLLCFLFYLWLFSPVEAPGWISLISGILLVGGIQMVFLGLIGEYIGRIFEQTKNRPLYIIAEKTDTFSEKNDPTNTNE